MNPSLVSTTTPTTAAAAVAVKEDGKKELLVVITEESTGETKGQDHEEEEDCGRERLKRHRVEMAGRVWIPEIWGQESFLKDWIDCAAFDASLVPKGLLLAREALVQECQIDNRC